MFGPLFVKTNNSLLSSLIRIDDLIRYAKDNNIKALSITDDNMYGVMEFYKKCKLNDIKPIVGLNVFNLVLYCKNYNGYQNLIKLSTILSEREVTIDDLDNIMSYTDTYLKSFIKYRGIVEDYIKNKKETWILYDGKHLWHRICFLSKRRINITEC